MIGKPRRIRIKGKRKKLRSKVPSISKLIKECDKALSLRVRQNRPDFQGIVYCFTCNHPMPWRKSQCGHFISRYYKAVRWHPDNVRIQCFMCNIARRGDPITFRENLVAEIGEKRVLDVEALRNTPIKMTREFLQNKLAELQNMAHQSYQ